MVTSDVKPDVEIWSFRACATKICIVCGRITEIFAFYRNRNQGEMKSMVTLDFRPDVEIWPISHCGLDYSRSLENLSWEHCPPKPNPKEKFLHGVSVLVNGYVRVRFYLPSFINFRDINGFTKLWTPNPHQGSPWRVQTAE